MFPVRILFLLLVLVGGFVVGLTGSRWAAAGSGPLRSLLATDTCADPPCFLSIGLHETSIDHARSRLAAHERIRAVADRPRMSFVGDEHLRFDWQPGTTWRPGELIASYGTVYEIWLESDVTLGALLEAFDVPSVYSYTALLDRADGIRLYATFFDDARLRLTVRVACPLTLAHVLEAQVEVIELRRVQLAFRPGSPLDSIGDWYRHMALIPVC